MKRKIDPNMYVNMDHVLGDLAYEYGIPYMQFKDLVLLGQHAVRVYNLHPANRISFDCLCTHIRLFICTPFGRKVMHEIVKI